MNPRPVPSSAFDRFRQRYQAEFFARMPQRLARLRWSRAEIAAHQRDRLRDLLAHALEHSPFHSRRLRGVDPSRVELADLAALPVMTKAELMANFDDCLTDRRLSRSLVEETLAATRGEPIPIFDEYFAQVTGGSSGQRGVFVHDLSAAVEFTTSILRSPLSRMGGSFPPNGVTIGLVAASSAVHATGAGPVWLAGSPARFFPVPATLPLGEIVRRLNQIRPQLLFGYATMLARLAAEKQDGRLDVAPMSLTSTSETLTPAMRATIRAAFGVPIVDGFASTEGLVGTTAPDDAVFVFNTDGCIVELVDENDRPVAEGTPSAKILVTNLSSRAQPLIRYEMNDRFVRQPDAPDHGHLRATVEGRADAVLRFGATEIHPLVIRTVLVATPEVLDYQIRQTPKGIDATLLTTGPLDLAGLEGRLRRALAAAGLSAPEVRARTTDELDRHSQTGKLARFVPWPESPGT